MFGEMSLVWMLVGAGGLCLAAELLVRWVRRSDERDLGVSPTQATSVEQQRARFEIDLRGALDCLEEALLDLVVRDGAERRLTLFGDLNLYAHNGNRLGFDIERARRELVALAELHGFSCEFEGVNALDFVLVLERCDPTVKTAVAT